jgi:2-amino-4-hydroxy-6-hydroxymethyldihydropteridine diphosphokinase
MVVVYIGLGSNLENPLEQVRRAIDSLSATPQIQVTSVSSLYRSRPMGPQGQPDYINAVMAIETPLGADELLDVLQTIEQAQGRVRDGERWGPRTLDLDILLYGDAIMEQPRLKIPHPGLHERSFVLYPLYEIAPKLMVPGHGALVKLLESCENDLEMIGHES